MSPLIRRVLALTAVLGLLAAACGSSDASEPPSAPAPAAPEAPAPTAAPASTEAPAPTEAPVAADPSPEPAPAPSADASGRVVQPGDAISVHYVGTLDDGEEFDSSRRPGRQPLSFTVAAGQMIAGFDAAVQGMSLGEVKTVRIEAVDAYGEWSEDQVITVAIGDVPEGTAVGDELFSAGRSFLVLEVTETEVRLDANSELAGEALTFEIELVSFDN